jgi:hypothetical protein
MRRPIPVKSFFRSFRDFCIFPFSQAASVATLSSAFVLAGHREAGYSCCAATSNGAHNWHELREDIAMIVCDLCAEAKDCLQKEIDGREYDICSECWSPFAQKLKGKGRAKNREAIFLPARPVREREEDEPKPHPGQPPKILGTSDRVH